MDNLRNAQDNSKQAEAAIRLKVDKARMELRDVDKDIVDKKTANEDIAAQVEMYSKQLKARVPLD